MTTSYTLRQPRAVGWVTAAFIATVVTCCQMKKPPHDVLWVVFALLYGFFLLSHVEKKKS